MRGLRVGLLCILVILTISSFATSDDFAELISGTWTGKINVYLEGEKVDSEEIFIAFEIVDDRLVITSPEEEGSFSCEFQQTESNKFSFVMKDPEMPEMTVEYFAEIVEEDMTMLVEGISETENGRIKMQWDLNKE